MGALLSSFPWGVVELAMQPRGLVEPGRDKKRTENRIAEAMEKHSLHAPEVRWWVGFGADTPRGKKKGSFE